jgi:hypothetical protein
MSPAIHTIILQTVRALSALGPAPGDVARLQAHHPALVLLEACLNQRALASDRAAVTRFARAWLRAWEEALTTPRA